LTEKKPGKEIACPRNRNQENILAIRNSIAEGKGIGKEN
jgi:hypothetical protein